MEMLKQPDLKGWNVKVDVATLISNKIYHIVKSINRIKKRLLQNDKIQFTRRIKQFQIFMHKI